MHHCAFEAKPSANVVGQSANSQSSECPSHSNDGSAPHQEGQPCGAAAISNGAELSQASALAIVPIFVSLISVEGYTSHLDFKDDRNPDIKGVLEALFLTQLAHSLSLSPNAPPKTLV